MAAQLENALFLRGFQPPGPKAAAWIHSRHEFPVLMGPVGGGKTTSGFQKCIEICRLQHPSTVDGVRKALIVAIRMNYRHMHRTLMRSAVKFFGAPKSEFKYSKQDMIVWEWEKNGPCKVTVRWYEPTRGKHELVIEFVSVGDNDLEDFIRGYEPTAFWLNETDELPPGCIGFFVQRTGRAYIDEKPDPDLVPPVVYSRVFGDCNAPDIDNWLAEDYINAADPPAGFALYRQPSGFSPDAENLHILRRDDPDYYRSKARAMMMDKGAWAVKRFIENEPGMSRDGNPVFFLYKDSIHAAQSPTDYQGGKLIIGIDNGLTPAVAICESHPSKGLILHHEIVTPEGEQWGAYEIGKRAARKLIAEFGQRALNFNIEFAPDPACLQQSQGDKTPAIAHFLRGWQEVAGFGVGRLTPAQSNRLGPRIAAVNEALKVIGGFTVSPACRYARRALSGGYKFQRVSKDNGRFHDEPVKNEYSHIMDALQYAAQRHSPQSVDPAGVSPWQGHGSMPRAYHAEIPGGNTTGEW